MPASACVCPERVPDQRVVASLYNRYCVRCHGIDGRGVWDIPDVPDFANARWQASRTDDQLTRLIIDGRGAVMPAFRGTLTLEESWALARYLRTFVPGSEASRPRFDKKNGGRKDRDKREANNGGEGNGNNNRQKTNHDRGSNGQEEFLLPPLPEGG